MRRTPIAGAVLAVGLAVAAGCSSTAAPGSGALGGVATTPAPDPTSGVTSTVPTATTKPPTTKPTVATTKTKTAAPTSSWPSPADCVSYDPTKLTLDGSASSGTFIVSAGSTVVIRVHGQDDQTGQQALALARTYTRHCYIGRGNTREAAGDYIFDYWRDPSGQTPAIPGLDDACSPYNNHNLTVEDMGDGNGWRVKDHDHVLHVFDNGTDARNADIVLAKYTRACSIGDILDTDNDLGAVTFQEP